MLQADNTLSKANRAGQFDAAKNLHVEMISQGMESAISSGNWTIRRFRMERKGVTQVRRRLHNASKHHMLNDLGLLCAVLG